MNATTTSAKQTIILVVMDVNVLPFQRHTQILFASERVLAISSKRFRRCPLLTRGGHSVLPDGTNYLTIGARKSPPQMIHHISKHQVS